MSQLEPSEDIRADQPAVPLVFPDRLYGREQEFSALTRAFAEVGAGAGQVLLLPGHSGSGKTALVHALREPVRRRNGFFLEGKFNQYQQGIPLFALRQALRQLARQLRGEDPSAQRRWKSEILEAVGNLGRLLTDLAPEWEAFLGPQPFVPEISPYETPHRFASVVRRFLAVFSQAEHPVVLFVDDWQWADATSLVVLRHLQVNTTLRYLLVLAAYRDTEVDADHPLSAAVEELRRQAVPVATLAVPDLGFADIRTLLGDTLTPAAADLDALAAFLQGTTQGNPFFMRALLESLHASRALWFDPAQQAWRWNGQSPTGRDRMGDVVGLFSHNLRRLSVECRDLLALAACLGNRFDLHELAMVSEQPAAACLKRLSQALTQRAIRGLDGEPGLFMFQHDRVQQAAHAIIAPGQLPEVRLRIGRLLQGQLTPAHLDERLLEIVDHYNAGRALLRSESEQTRLVELNIAAGRKAGAATAYRTALQFHRVAGEFLARPEFAATFWSERHEPALQFFKDWAESEFLEGNRSRAEGCIQEAVVHARTPIEQADALCALILQNTLLARYPDAITAGRRALAALGIALPDSEFEAARDAEIARVRQRLRGRSMAALRGVPPMSDPTMLMATRVLITLGPPCYRAHQRLWSVLVPKVVDLTLQYGPVPQVGYSHTAFGGLLGWVDNDYATAKQFGELAEWLMSEVFRSPSDQSVFHLMMGSSTRHWFAPLSVASEDYTHAWEAGLRSGNLQYAAYAFGHNMYCRFYQGIPLAGIIEESQVSLAFSRTRTNQWAIDLLEGGLQVFGLLAGRVSSASWSETAYLREVDAHHNIQVACIYRVLRAFSLLMLNEPEHALAWSDEAEPLMYTVGTQGLLPWPEHVFTRLLILATLFPQADVHRRAAWRGEMDRMAAQLEVWATYAPENYRFKLALARAEMARLEERAEASLGLYEEAVEAAQTGRFTQWEAWANERAAQLALGCGQESLAQPYWQEAYFAYHRWGALAKVSLLEREFLSRTTGRPGGQTAFGPRIEKYLRMLRARAARQTEAASHPEPSQLVRELAQATEHLREEVAQRKQAEAELQRRRDQLALEMEARTKTLEVTRELARKSEAQARQLEEQHRRLIEAQAATLQLITEATAARQRAEQANVALRESEERLRLAGEAARIGTWERQLPANRLIWSPLMEQMMGYEPGTFPGTDEAFCELLHPDSRAEHAAAQQRARHGDGSFQAELRFRLRNGRERWGLVVGRRFCDATGHPSRILGIDFDITERKSLEEQHRAMDAQLRQQQRLESIGTLASGVAHEINNPITGIMNYAQLVQDRLPPESPLIEFTREIIQETQRVAAIVRNLLTFARNEKQSHSPARVADIIEGTLSLIRTVIRRDQISLTLSIPEDLPQLKCRTQQIQQVLMNLVTNARDALNARYAGHHPDKTMHLSARLMVKEERRWIRVTVEDHGTGITPEVRERMFDPFFTTKPRHQGTGLGMSISHGIVKEHHGEITVESEPGEFTCVHVDLPVDNGWAI